jgi:hypothetical protein
MPKDYQEDSELALKKILNIVALAQQYYIEIDMEGLEKELTTYGNARVEEIIKIIESLKIEGDNQFSGDKREDVADYLNDWLMPEIKRNLIEAIKK